MKKRVLSILLTMCMGLALLPVTAFAEPDGVEINETNFPDDAFRTIFVSQFDTDSDGFLSAEEIDAVTTIDCSYVGPMYSIKGIEYFPALTVLKCSGNQISSLDISQNPNLIELDCSNNILTSLDVSQNPNLEILNCDVNQLTSLDVSQNPNLSLLICVLNKRTFTDINNGTIDLSALPGFDVNKASNWNGGTVNGNILYVDENAETVSYTYDCGNKHSEMFTFIIAPNSTAEGVEINETNFPDDAFRNSCVSEFDVDGNGFLSEEEIAAVTIIGCYQSDEIADLTGIEYFTALEILDCYVNQVTSLDISHNPNLTELYCEGSCLTTLDVSHNPELNILNCGSSQLTSLDVSKNPKLTELYCGRNKLTTLDVSQNSNLTVLYCFDNQLTSLDISQNPNLIRLSCASNQLTDLNVSQNQKLTELYCGNNELTSVDVRQNQNLTNLSYSNNPLQWMDVSQNPNLTELYCKNNNLKSLDVSQNPNLTWLNCDSNQLTSIDVSNNTNLIWLNCSDNSLSSLDVNQNINLVRLDCFNNQLTLLDVKQNPNLEELYCQNNQLTALDLSQNMRLWVLTSGNNQRTFTNIENGTIDLAALPGFDVNRASNWKGGIVHGNVLYIDDNATSITYTYDCGNNKSETFTLNVSPDYTITYQYGDQVVTDIKNHGLDLTLQGDIFTKTGYRQIGWATTDGGAAVYDLGGSYSDNAAITLYPVWSEMSDYEVSFNTNGGSEIKNKVNVKWTDKVLNEVTAPTKDGYIFTGWICGDMAVDENTTYAELAVKDTVKSVTLTAQYQAVQKPEMIEGESATVVEGENVTMTFRSNAAFRDFIRVELDGEVLDEKNYTKKEGSTIIILNADFVATLTPGEHTLSIVSGGASAGVATAKFTVNTKTTESTSNENSVQTGDNSNLALWFSLLAISGVGLAGTTIFNKKRTKDNQ